MKPTCYIRVTVFFEQEKDSRWTAECKELGTATFGNTFEEAREFIEVAILMHLNALQKNKQIDRFFKENGIRVIRERPTENIMINVPINPNIFVKPFTYPVRMQAGVC
jgi:predicted RNase H-like HicB family nuclease